MDDPTRLLPDPAESLALYQQLTANLDALETTVYQTVNAATDENLACRLLLGALQQQPLDPATQATLQTVMEQLDVQAGRFAAIRDQVMSDLFSDEPEGLGVVVESELVLLRRRWTGTVEWCVESVPAALALPILREVRRVIQACAMHARTTPTCTAVAARVHAATNLPSGGAVILTISLTDAAATLPARGRWQAIQMAVAASGGHLHWEVAAHLGVQLVLTVPAPITGADSQDGSAV